MCEVIWQVEPVLDVFLKGLWSTAHREDTGTGLSNSDKRVGKWQTTLKVKYLHQGTSNGIVV